MVLLPGETGKAYRIMAGKSHGNFTLEKFRRNGRKT
jgi:hypothetical protein